MLEKYEDISSKESIDFYYDQLYFSNDEYIKKSSISECCRDHLRINLREYDDNFKLIPEDTVSVVVEQDTESKNLIEEFRKEKSIRILRKLQKYAFTVYKNELDILIGQGVIENIDGLLILKNNDYYSSKTGISFESNDYII